VGAGNVLADLLRSRRVPSWRLTQIYRQRESSLIVENAHRILEGRLPRLPETGDLGSDFYLFPAEGERDAADRLVDVVTRRIPERFGLRWEDDVQVLSPMYRGACGVDALNERLRGAAGSSGEELQTGARAWRAGDRVIHVRNDYERGIFNGDMGRIASVDVARKSVLVRFPDQDLEYTPRQLGDLQPAFAITVHRSQGGEFPAVVLPLVPQHYVMLQRHVLYTAVTRAQRLCVLVGSPRALRMAVENESTSRRESGLAHWLEELAPSR
jgi:exodeoxyribonuclease V alpha subunit